jgi:hypothetical protein
MIRILYSPVLPAPRFSKPEDPYIQARTGNLFDITASHLLKEAFTTLRSKAPTEAEIRQRLAQPSLSESERQTLSSLGTPQGPNTLITWLQRQGDLAMRRSAGRLLPSEEREEFFRLSREATELFQTGRARQNAARPENGTPPEFQVGPKEFLLASLNVIDKARRDAGAGKFLVRLATAADAAARQGAAQQLTPTDARQFQRLANTATQVFTLGRQKALLQAELETLVSREELLKNKRFLSTEQYGELKGIPLLIQQKAALLTELPRLKRAPVSN